MLDSDSDSDYGASENPEASDESLEEVEHRGQLHNRARPYQVTIQCSTEALLPERSHQSVAQILFCAQYIRIIFATHLRNALTATSGEEERGSSSSREMWVL